MINETKVHRDTLSNSLEHTIRVGESVPDGAVNLAYFHNTYVASGASVLVADAPKQVIDYLPAERTVHKEALPNSNDGYFESHISVTQGDYSGRLKREHVVWTETEHVDEKEVYEFKELIVEDPDAISEAIAYSENNYVGTLMLINKESAVHESEEVETKEKLYREGSRFVSVDNLPQPHYDWPNCWADETGNEIFTDVAGYSGRLELQADSVIYAKRATETIGVAIPYVAYYEAHEEIPQSFTKDGIIYELKVKNTVYGENRYYGFTRYYGHYYGFADKEGIYGTPMDTNSGFADENGYVTDEDGNKQWGRGKFSGAYPFIKAGLHSASSLTPYASASDVTSDGEGYPHHQSLKFDKTFQGIDWMIDTGFSPTGHVWADEWFADHDELPSGYKPLGGGTPLSLETGLRPNLNKINVGPTNDPYGRKGYWLIEADGEMNDLSESDGKLWFRDVITFYADDELKIEAHYIGYRPDGTADLWESQAVYRGVLEREVTNKETIAKTWRTHATYQGKAIRRMSAYAGTAKYSGTISKQDTTGNIEPSDTNYFIAKADSNGLLTYEGETGWESAFASERFRITKHFKEGEPLFYEGMLSAPFYYPHDISPFEYYTGDAIKLTTQANRALRGGKLYQIKLFPIEGETHLYWVHLYTNFETSSKSHIYATYNSYDAKGSGAARLIVSKKEKLTTQPAYILKEHYETTKSETTAGATMISVLDATAPIIDDRSRLKVYYRINAIESGLQTTVLEADVVNVKYALPDELALFRNGRMNISPQNSVGLSLTPYELILFDNPELTDTEREALKADLFEVVKVSKPYSGEGEPTEDLAQDIMLSVQADGLGVVEAQTSADTGFYNPSTQRFDLTQKIDMRYIRHQNQLHLAYAVQCQDIRAITVSAPRETGALESWYPRINQGRFSTIRRQTDGLLVKLTYTLPEFELQHYNSLRGKPFQDVVELATFVNEKMVRVRNFPIVAPYSRRLVDGMPTSAYLTVEKQTAGGARITLDVSRWHANEGLIELEQTINENDAIYVSYTYEVDAVAYRGYVTGNRMVDLDLNPNIYHTYSDPRFDYQRRHVCELFNAVVYFFLKPSTVEVMDEEGNISAANTAHTQDVIYHKIDDSQIDHENDLMIGSVYVRHNTSLQNTTLVDTRQRGGGVITLIDDELRRALEPESDYYWDIGHWDGSPYSENGVVIIRLDRRLLKQHGGLFTAEKIETLLHKWSAFGTKLIIEYVKCYQDEELPQQTLEIKTTLLEQRQEAVTLYATTQTAYHEK